MIRLDPDDVTDRLAKLADEVLRDGRIDSGLGLLLFRRLRELRDDIVTAISPQARRTEPRRLIANSDATHVAGEAHVRSA